MKRTGWTWGAEHEFANIRRNDPLPNGFGWDQRDCTIVNENGIANCPRGVYYPFGGEVNTPPTDTISAQVDHLSLLKERYPEACVNYRSNTHCHVRVPGLRENLTALKRFARYNDAWLAKVLPLVEPIPCPTEEEYPRPEDYRGALRRYKRRKKSHQTILTSARVARQQAAQTVEGFFELEVPFTADGVPMWHAAPRAAVNLRQLRETDTVEFRHFPGTLNENELRACLLWVEHYTQCALLDWNDPADLDPYLDFCTAVDVLPTSAWRLFPWFEPYQHALEVRYRATCHDGSLPKETITKNIAAILDGSFDEEAWQNLLKW